nr:transposase [Streptomyces mexicanus]
MWEIAKPLIPPSKVRPQGGGTQDTPDETLFAATIDVLASGCAWRALPPCFGISRLRDTRIGVSIARKGIESGERLGCRRRVIERTMSWQSGYRRLSCHYERDPRDYLAFLGLAAAIRYCNRLVRLTA